MSSSEVLDVTSVCTAQVRSHGGLRLELVTETPSDMLLRGFAVDVLEARVGNPGKLTDLISTFRASIFLMSDRFKAALERDGTSGWGATPVRVANWQFSPIWLLTVHGKCGPLYGTQGVPLQSGLVGSFLDPFDRDGSDMFLPPNHNAVLVTGDCAARLARSRLSNLSLENAALEPFHPAR